LGFHKACPFQVKKMRHGKEIKMDLMVMENLMFGHDISRIYDLKGSTFSRHVNNSDDADTVYLDQNFVEDMGVSPIYIGGRTKHLLQRAIWNDTSFLTVCIMYILQTQVIVFRMNVCLKKIIVLAVS
jgi:1-phosphatidylinositol-3-phosphate 5-kinase